MKAKVQLKGTLFSK